jgi:uncharacterized protein (DUF58 family)
MPRPRAEAAALASRWRLVVPQPARGGFAGERLGRGPGSSLEFEDRRAYVAGDDVRHLDWSAYARTDQLQVRLHREEVVPRLDLVLDASRSMAVDEEKGQRAVDLAAFLAEAARRAGLAARVIAVGERIEPVEPARFAAEGVLLGGRRNLLELLPATLALLRPRALLIVVSDFLFPHDPAELVRPLQARAGPMALLQVVSSFDAAPTVGAAARLTDAESDATHDLVLDAGAVSRYSARFAALRDALATECRRASAPFIPTTADTPLEIALRRDLLPCGLIEP